MPRPRLSVAMTWGKFEASVIQVFDEALARLADIEELPAAEEPINLQLFWLAKHVHHQLLNSPKGSIPFSIMSDTTNQPEVDDSARSKRMKKKPDFSCVLNNHLEPDYLKAQAIYNLECKRLGLAVKGWVLNENYAEHGMLRFVHEDWQYAKGCVSAVMIGYLQNMDPEDVLSEVNANATPRSLPSLKKAAAAWKGRSVTTLAQPTLSRAFGETSIELKHLWVDLRHCQFTIPSDVPPQIPAPAKSSPKKKAAIKAAPKPNTAAKARVPKVGKKAPKKKT